MCNEIKCAIQYTVDNKILIKNTDVQENVQIGCTGYVNIAAVWMMANNVYSLLN